MYPIIYHDRNYVFLFKIQSENGVTTPPRGYDDFAPAILTFQFLHLCRFYSIPVEQSDVDQKCPYKFCSQGFTLYNGTPHFTKIIFFVVKNWHRKKSDDFAPVSPTITMWSKYLDVYVMTHNN